MKRSIIIILLLLFAFGVPSHIFSQNGIDYRIDDPGSYNQTLLETAMDNAHLDAYRRLETERRLNFDSGAEVTLFPAKHLQSRGIAVDLSLALSEDAVIDPNRVFMVHSSGILMEAVRPSSSVK